MTDELEALFDEISAQNQAETTPTPVTEETVPAQSSAEESEDTLEALFDEVSSQFDNTVSDASVEVTFEAITEITAPETTSPAASGEESEEELETLFDELSTHKATISTDSETTEKPAEEMALEKPVDLSDVPLYDRVGGILRTLHNSMRELGYDRALQDVAVEVNDAKGRLEYVATLTEQAATKVLNSIDTAMPRQEELTKTASDLEQKWTDLFNGNMDVDSFRQLAQDSSKFISSASEIASQEKSLLMEIMMAQDFQDITGQVIKKVVFITKKLEQELAQLLRDNAPPETKEKVVDLMAGPDIPDKAMDQDDVDSLLENLGF